MSHWHEPKKEDIDIDGDDIDIYLYSDDFGAVYCTLKISMMKEVLAEHEKKTIQTSKGELQTP